MATVDMLGRGMSQVATDDESFRNSISGQSCFCWVPQLLEFQQRKHKKKNSMCCTAHCGKCRGFFVKFLAAISLEIEEQKYAKKMPQSFANLLQTISRERRSGGLAGISFYTKRH